MKTKRISRFWKVVRIVLLAIVTVLVLWIIFNKTMTAYEKNKHPAVGQLVEVDGNNMHIYTKGKGDNTIVLLSGLGTSASVLDFEPLTNELAKNNKVVVVELFGYGWSDMTEKERTVENIVEEIRIALQKASIKGPYILMPHSISGIYSMYYANKYPEEIEAVIGIDPTLPGFNHSPHPTPKVSESHAMTGISDGNVISMVSSML
ncbi:alpha/beta hydrolase [Planococcus shenhongbingii]|uniref:alpha/beta fold hydrolase n=1 Tax=Planococcus shenhongbingii TaxID=3058398 RepID=UPI0026164849|nr:alpha/beta hydrolase [Planococcus sp. N016]WKA60312.1 alpha/beta hydrolase [Planococcus sp. N016]